MNTQTIVKKVLYLLLASALAVALLGPIASPLQATPTAVTFSVDTGTDAHDSNLGDGICHNGIDGCSLRAAIEQAFSVSSVSNPVTIHFWSGIAGTLTLDLGPINWAASYVTLDGETNGMIISGSGLSAGQSIFTVSGSHNTITHLTIRNAPQDGVQLGDFAGVGEGNYNTVTNVTLIGNSAAGVYVHGSSSSGGQNNAITSNFIGLTDDNATSCVTGEGNGGNGIYIDASAATTTIAANYLVCSGLNGIHIAGASGAPNGTLIQNNSIGLNLTGAMPNAGQGVLDEQGLNTTLTGNAISGNGAAGVWLLGSTEAVLINNRIGTDINGAMAIPNGIDGVAITDGATNNTVGGSTSSTERNRISGNAACGVRIRDGATNNTVDYNLIGLNDNGTAAIPNQLAGVCIINANHNTIGTSIGGVYQYISGNTREGIYIENSSDNSIGPTNRIGVASDDTTVMGNGLQGVVLSGASNTSVSPNIVSYNGDAGIAVIGNAAIGNYLYPIHTRGNGGLAIDLGNDGHTANGSQTPPGPNNWMNYPQVTITNSTSITGTACANCLVHVYSAIGDPTANGGGGTFVSSTTADASGNWHYTFGLGITAVTLVACDSSTFNCSEMSPRYGEGIEYHIYLPMISR